MADGRICLYDEAAVAAFAPVPIADVRAPLDAAQRATLDAAGAALAASTAALCAAVRDEAPDAEMPAARLSADGARRRAGGQARQRAARLGGAGLRSCCSSRIMTG